MRDFDRRWKEFDEDFEKAKRRAKWVALIALPFYLIGALLILGLLAVALYALAHYVGLI